MTSRTHVLLYRNQFLIMYVFQTPQFGADVSHVGTSVEKSAKLVDLRFPKL